MAENNLNNPSLATRAPVLQPTREEIVATENLNSSLDRYYSPKALARRLDGIEAESKKFKDIQAEATNIEEKSKILAAAVIAGIERKAEVE